jgi:virginiamycin B lyase
MRSKVIALAFTALILAAALANAGPIWVDHAALTATGIAYEINRDGAGNIIVTDWGAGEIWRVRPATGAYSRFKGAWHPNDARPDAVGNIWWTDYYNPVLARINTSAGPVSMTTWNLSAWDSARTYKLSGLAMDESGGVWFSEWGEVSDTQLLYRFDPGRGELCGYTLPGGDHSYYVLYSGGFLWLGDWVQGRIVRLNPANLQVTYWSVSPQSEPRGLAADAAGAIWWADVGAGRLGRLEPAANRITTYNLPVNGTPYMVSVEGGRIWYTSEGVEVGNVGVLYPALASGSSTTKNPTTWTSTQTCASAGAGTTAAITPATGAFSWASAVWPDVTPAGAIGWTIFEVSWGGIPYGVLADASYAWVTDETYQKLVRIALADVPTPTPMVATTPGSNFQASFPSKS